MLYSNGQSLDEVSSRLLFSGLVPQLPPQLLHKSKDHGPKTPEDSMATGVNSCVWRRLQYTSHPLMTQLWLQQLLLHGQPGSCRMEQRCLHKWRPTPVPDHQGITDTLSGCFPSLQRRPGGSSLAATPVAVIAQ